MINPGGIPLRARLLLLVLIPSIGMLWFSALDSWRQYRQVRETEQLRELLAATQQFDALARELAAERGLFFAFSGTAATRRRVMLERQFAVTDAAFEELTRFMEQSRWIGRELPKIWHEYQRLQADTAQLLADRSKRRNVRLESMDEVAGYTESISYIQDIKALLQELGADQQVAVLGRVYDELQEVILALGFQRAIGAWVLTHDELPFTLGNSLLHTQSRIALSERRLAAMPDSTRYTRAFPLEAEMINESLINNFLGDVQSYFQRLHNFRHLQSRIGYGGLIHQFKNYVLRGEEQYLIGFEEQWAAVQRELDQAIASGTVNAEDVARVRQIQETFENYAQRIVDVEEELAKGTDIRAIDRKVRLNDLPAIEAVDTLFQFSNPISSEEWFRIQSQRIVLYMQRGDLVIQDMLHHKDAQHDEAQAQLVRNTAFTVFLLFVGILLVRWIYRDILGSVRSAARALTDIAQTGQLQEPPASNRMDEIGDLQRALALLVHNSQSIVFGAGRIGEGDYSVQIEPRSRHDELAHALNAMVNNLQRLSSEQALENQLQARLVHVSSILRQESSINAVAEAVLRYICEELDAPAGVLYLLQEDGRYLPAFSLGIERAGVSPLIPGAGIVGQALETREITPVTGLPPDYLHLRLRSGTGQAQASAVYIVPMWDRHTCVCAIEIGCFRELPPEALEFLRRIQEPLALGMQALNHHRELEVYVAELSQRKQALEERELQLQALNESLQEKTDHLSASEEELRMANDELRTKSESLEASHRQLEQQAQQLEQASRYKTEFLANMSHELRTPLNSILILSQLLAENPDGRLDEDEVRSARTIENSGRSLLALINDILDLSKVEAGMLDIVPGPVGVRALVEDLQALFQPQAKEKQLQLLIDVDEAVPVQWLTDGHRVTQILRNFLSNALKFTANGHVRLHVAMESAPDADAGTPALLRFDVEDTGIGIDPAQLKRVFEEFQQEDGSISREFGGTGLGLAISRRLGELLGGHVKAISAKGQGSTFSLLIPELEAPAGERDGNAAHLETIAPTAAPPLTQDGSPPAAPDDSLVQKLRGRRIIVADDDSRTCFATSAMLRPYELQVVLARSGAQCLDKLTQYPDTCCVVMDLVMPGMDGLETMRRMQEDPRWQGIPVLVLTASDAAEARPASLAAGADAFMSKPSNGPQLAAELARLIEENA